MVYSFYPFIQLSSHEEQLQGFLIFIYCDRLYFPKLATFHMLFQNLVTSPEPCKLILSQEPPNVTSSEMKDKYLLILYFLVCSWTYGPCTEEGAEEEGEGFKEGQELQ